MDRCTTIRRLIQGRIKHSLASVTCQQNRTFGTTGSRWLIYRKKNAEEERRKLKQIKQDKMKIVRPVVKAESVSRVPKRIGSTYNEEENIPDEPVFERSSESRSEVDTLPLVARLAAELEISTEPSNKEMTSLDKTLMSLESKIKFIKSELGKFDAEYKDPDYRLKQLLLGQSDASVEPSDIPCGGCGALLHCTNPVIPGFMTADQFKKALRQNDLMFEICMRCELFENNQFLQVEMEEDSYKTTVIDRINADKNALVLMVVDVTDIANTLIKDYATDELKQKPLAIVANKIDLIPPDSGGHKHLYRLKDRIVDECYRHKLDSSVADNIFLISAKTGFGVEQMINKLIKNWKNKGNVYLVGTTNSGKSTLFNKLLESDYCKSSCRDIVQRATISKLPGTTLDLLKFPLSTWNHYDLHLRAERLKEQAREDLKMKEKQNDKLDRFGGSGNVVLFGTVGQTDMRTDNQKTQDLQKYSVTGGQFFEYSYKEKAGKMVLNSPVDLTYFSPKKRTIQTDEYPASRWVYDTPGLINSEQLMNYLIPEELQLMMKMPMIRPRVYIIKPGDTMFVTGLARIDYLQGALKTYATVHLMHLLPVRVVKTREADKFYEESKTSKEYDWLFKLPVKHENRIKELPPLEGKHYTFTLKNHILADVDVQLSTLGWVSFAGCTDHAEIQVSTPGGKGIHLRTPALLPNMLTFKGVRIKNTQAYAMRKVKPRIVSKLDTEMNEHISDEIPTMKVKKEKIVSGEYVAEELLFDTEKKEYTSKGNPKRKVKKENIVSGEYVSEELLFDTEKKEYTSKGNPKRKVKKEKLVSGEYVSEELLFK